MLIDKNVKNGGVVTYLPTVCGECLEFYDQAGRVDDLKSGSREIKLIYKCKCETRLVVTMPPLNK